jgi:ethanolamine utilization protein EutP (predicted NTPase)
MKYLSLAVVLLVSGALVHAEDAKKVKYAKTQQVNFENQDIDGKVNSPDGAYLLQKRGVQFLPLYKVNNQFEKNILESVEYLR